MYEFAVAVFPGSGRFRDGGASSDKISTNQVVKNPEHKQVSKVAAYL